jgi:hypothetical protein
MKMNNRISKTMTLLFLFCSLTLLQNGYGQIERQNTPRYWIGAGAGIGYPAASNRASLSGVVFASYQSGRHLIGLRSAATGEFFNDSFYDLGIIYGRSMNRNNFFLSFGTGAAVAAGKRSGGLFDDSESVGPIFGLPIELQLFIRPLRFAGVGIYAFTNLNREQTFGGAAFSVQIGKMGRW